jgi:Mn-dependent DtxR family transcriptional regulator
MTGSPPRPLPDSLTPREADVLIAVRDFLAAHGDISPRLDDIGRRLGVSHEAVRLHLLNLCERGIVTYTRGAHRSVKITDAGRAALQQMPA